MSESSRRPGLSGEKLGMPALVFDLDGTLVDSDDHVVLILSRSRIAGMAD